MKKQIISLILLLAMSLSLCATALAAPADMSVEEEKDYLGGVCKIPDSFLDSVGDDVISDLYEEAVENNVTVSSYEEVMEAMDSRAATRASIPASDFSLRTLVLKVTDRTGKQFMYYDVYTYYEWFNKAPFWRLGRDGVTVNWDNSLFYYKEKSFIYYGYSKLDGMDYWKEYDRFYQPDKVTQGGLGVSFDLLNSDVTYLKGTIFFRLGSDSFGCGKTTTINSNYGHTYLSTAPSVSFGASGAGVGFTTSFGRKFCSSSTNVKLA